MESREELGIHETFLTNGWEKTPYRQTRSGENGDIDQDKKIHLIPENFNDLSWFDTSAVAPLHRRRFARPGHARRSRVRRYFDARSGDWNPDIPVAGRRLARASARRSIDRDGAVRLLGRPRRISPGHSCSPTRTLIGRTAPSDIDAETASTAHLFITTSSTGVVSRGGISHARTGIAETQPNSRRSVTQHSIG